MPIKTEIKYAFFGSSRFSVIVMDEMKNLGFTPILIVTTPDKPKGRKLLITPNVVRVWANENGVNVLSPERIDAQFVEEFANKCAEMKCETSIVASYGKILPNSILDILPKKILNIHPSLLPKYRGASPLQTAILEDTKHAGVTIMRIDSVMDHGPIVAQSDVNIAEWAPYEDFELQMATEGAKLLVGVLPKWINGEIREIEQNHAEATFTKKTKKEDGLIDLSGDAYTNFRKIQAYHEWPQAYFVFDHNGKNVKVKITSANFVDGKLMIEKVIPEGSREMAYEEFLNGYKKIQ